MGGKKFYSDTGFEYMHNMDSRETIFILDNFDGSLFQQLNKNRCRIVAPPVIIKCAFNSEVCSETQTSKTKLSFVSAVEVVNIAYIVWMEN